MIKSPSHEGEIIKYFLGLVISYDDEKNLVCLEQRNYFKVGDVVEFFGPNTKTFEYKIEEVFNDMNESIDIVRHPKQIVTMKVSQPLEKFDMMRIKKD